jgi:hypothetical protein
MKLSMSVLGSRDIKVGGYTRWWVSLALYWRDGEIEPCLPMWKTSKEVHGVLCTDTTLLLSICKISHEAQRIVLLDALILKWHLLIIELHCSCVNHSWNNPQIDRLILFTRHNSISLGMMVGILMVDRISLYLFLSTTTGEPVGVSSLNSIVNISRHQSRILSY